MSTATKKSSAHAATDVQTKERSERNVQSDVVSGTIGALSWSPVARSPQYASPWRATLLPFCRGRNL
jgi:hypothetical protein